nr:unnamed protein product [Digitaria exilis]
MDRSRSKRGYHYGQDSPPPRSKQRFDRRSGGGQNPNSGYHRRGPPSGGGGSDRRGFLPPDAAPPPPPPPPPPPSAAAGAPGAASTTTSFRILCPECKAYGFPPGFIGKVRDDSGALVTVHPPFAGDYVRIIETVDGARREADGRPPMYSPAQEALLMVHRRILETEAEDGDEDGEYGPRGKDPRDRGKTTTRLIVPKLHVGCLLGKGGKIIEQMRMETKTHIRILPRDQHTPRCVSLSEEVVQVVGDGNCVRKAVAIITDRLKESLHRDRGPFRGRMNSPEPRISQEDEYLGGVQQMPVYEETYGRSDQIRNNIIMEAPGYEFDSNGGKVIEHPDILYGDIVFRILCPNDKASILLSTRDGIIEMLQADVGVDVRLTDIIAGSDERVVIITSREDSGGSASGSFEQGSNINDDIRQNATKRFAVPLVTRSTLEVVIPNSAVASLTMRAGSKLAQISEMSGATVTLADDRPDVFEKVVQISGIPEQTEKAKSLLQGFILSIQDDS